MDIKNKKGMTLVEVVATVAILAIIMVPISLIFSTTYRNFNVESDKATAQESAREVLYGKGFYYGSYGVIGDLQRSNADLNKIKFDLLDVNNNNIGRSIAITGDDGITKRYSFRSGILYYEPDVTDLSVYNNNPDNNYLKEKSPNEREVKVIDFSVEKKVKDSNSNVNDLIIVTVKVECGQSGEIALESSYRIPVE